MKFDDVNEIKAFLMNMQNFFEKLSEEEEKKNQKLFEVNGIQEDLLHEIELADLNAIEIMKVAKALKQNRVARRKLKNDLLLIGTLKSFNKRFIEKGILADIKQLLKNIEMYEKTLQQRGYTPRVLKNLKCAKTEVVK